MTPREWAIQSVVLAYPSDYRAAHGSEIIEGLTEASADASRRRLSRHIASVFVHGWRTRVRAATGESRAETARQGVVLAVVAALGAALADAAGWRGWPYMFATGLLLTGLWAVLSDAGRLVRLFGGVAVVVAGHEFYDPYEIDLPLVGGFSVGIVVLVLALRWATGTKNPARYVGAVAVIGIAATILGGGLYPSTMYVLPMLLVVGLVAGAVDPRAAVAVTLIPVLVAVTRPEWTLHLQLDWGSVRLAAPMFLAVPAAYFHHRRNAPGHGT